MKPECVRVARFPVPLLGIVPLSSDIAGYHDLLAGSPRIVIFFPLHLLHQDLNARHLTSLCARLFVAPLVSSCHVFQQPCTQAILFPPTRGVRGPWRASASECSHRVPLPPHV